MSTWAAVAHALRLCSLPSRLLVWRHASERKQAVLIVHLEYMACAASGRRDASQKLQQILLGLACQLATVILLVQHFAGS